MSSDEWIQVAEFYSMAQARAAHALLRSASIPSVLKGTVTAIQLMAAPSFLEQARELLNSEVSEEDLIAMAEAPPTESGSGEENN